MICTSSGNPAPNVNSERNNVAMVMWIKNQNTLTILHGSNTSVNDSLQSSMTFLANNNATYIQLGTSPPSSILRFSNDHGGIPDVFDITISRIITF
jgi:hypothetical protein